MVWQVVVPGTHTVTVVYSVLMAGLESSLGPPLTTTLTTFEAGVTGPPPEDPATVLPPPHESVASEINMPQPMRSSLAAADLTADPPWTRRREWLAGGTRAP